MIRYSLAQLSVEPVDDGLWVGVLPEGPIVKVRGAGELILEVLWAQIDDSTGHTSAEVTRMLASKVVDLPADAELEVARFLSRLAGTGIVVSSRAGAE